MTLQNSEKRVDMLGAGAGCERVDVPTNIQDYDFITIVNITDNEAYLFPPNVDSLQNGLQIVRLGKYSSITLPLFAELRRSFNVVWTNPDGTLLTTTKTVRIIFSLENLGMNTSFAPSFTPPLGNVNITGDAVGLNKEATQLLMAQNVADSEVLLTAIENNTDGLEAAVGLLGTEVTLAAMAQNVADSEVLLTAIENNTDGLEAAVALLGTEVTLAAMAQNIADLETLITAIKDTTGIKKITDAISLGAAELKPGITPTIYNVTMTNANTEYSQALPANCRKFIVNVQSNDADFRLAFVTGKVAAPTAPYIGIKTGGGYAEDNINLAAGTIFFASPLAGKVLQIITWS